MQGEPARRSQSDETPDMDIDETPPAAADGKHNLCITTPHLRLRMGWQQSIRMLEAREIGL